MWGVVGVYFELADLLLKSVLRSPVFTFEAELLTASFAINYAWKLGWHRIWLESDSSYVVKLLSDRSNNVT